MILHIVQGDIRLPEHLLRIIAFRVKGDADTERYRGQPVRTRGEIPVDLLYFVLIQLPLIAAYMDHEYHKLIAADPADIIV